MVKMVNFTLCIFYHFKLFKILIKKRKEIAFGELERILK